MKKSKRALGLLLAILMLFSVVQTGFTALAAGDGSASAYALTPETAKRIEDPGVTVTATDVTRVASSIYSQASGNVIVPATPSGVPASDGAYADNALAGEKATYPTVTMKLTKDLDDIPQIKCTSGGTGVVMSTPAYDKTSKTYSWTITSGQANQGENLEFTITYNFKGRTYTNKAYSYVENILQPAGTYVYTRNKERENFLHDWHYTAVSAVTRVLGKGVYGSLEPYAISGSNTRGYYNAGANTFVENGGTEYNTYGYNNTSEGTRTFSANTYKSYADVYIDSSVTSSLADINLRMAVTMLPFSGENSTQSITNVIAASGVQNASAGLGGDANGMLGIAPATGSMSVGTQKVTTFSGTTYGANDTYTISTSFSSVTSYSGNTWLNMTYAPVVLRFHTVNKGELRTLIDNILYHNDPTSTKVANLNKGINPQSWYYVGGWSGFSSALSEAYCILNKPNATQNEINDAISTLQYAYDNLVLKGASYSEIYELQDEADTHLAKTDWYTESTYAALESALEPIEFGFNILFQDQVDAWASDIRTAINGLKVQEADYSAVNAAVAHAAELEQSINNYVDFSKVSAAVAAVRYNLTKEEQATVDGFAAAIENAIAALTLKKADYTEVDLAVSKAKSLIAFNYVSFTAVRSAVNKVKYNLDITKQETVDGFAAAINKAIAELVPKPADYVELEAVIAEAKALVPEHYESFAGVEKALKACENYQSIDILHQDEVTKLRVNLRNEINKLVMLDADYTRVDEAIRQAEQIDKSQRTPSSVEALNQAIGAVVRGLKINEQNRVNIFEENILNAINNLDWIRADYTKVDAAVQKANALDKTYWLDFSGVEAALNAVDYTLGVNRQAEVDAMAEKILSEIGLLVPGPADYTRVNAAIAKFNELDKSLYTKDSVEAIEDIIAGINWDLDRNAQAEVVGYAADINAALLELVEADADYSELIKLRDSIPSNLDELYTTASITAVTNVLSDIDWTKKAKDQAVVNQYVADLNTALKNLVYLPGDYSDVDAAIQEGYDIIENGSYPISQESIDAYEELVANINRNYNISQTEEIAALAASIRYAYTHFSYAESIHQAKIDLGVDKTSVSAGQVLTVSVQLQTDYYAAASAIPVLYDSTYFEVIGSNVTEALAFSGSYAANSKTSGILTSPDKGYPASYTSAMKSQWKYVYMTITPDSDISANATKLDPAQTVVTFQLRVKDTGVEIGTTETGRIWIDPAFLKTDTNRGGKLFVGRYPTETVSLDVITTGQTFDLAGADCNISIVNANSPADMTPLRNALDKALAYPVDYYTEDTYAVYTQAMADGQAVMDRADSLKVTDQDEVNAAAQAILDAYDALQLKPADTSALAEAVQLIPQYEQQYYTETSYAAFEEALAAGNAILAETNLTMADNERINSAAAAITEKYGSLNLKPFSHSDAAVEAMMNLPDDSMQYDPDTLEAFWTAYNALETFLNRGVTILDDEEGLGLINALNEAYAGLKLISANTAELEAAVALQPEHDSLNYTEDTYDAFTAAVANGNSILAREDLSYLDQADIDAAVTSINNAYKALKLKECTYTEQMLELINYMPIYAESKYIESYYTAYMNALDGIFAILDAEPTILDDAAALAAIDTFNTAVEELETIGLIGADYTKVNEAVATAEALDKDIYSNWEIVQTALDAVDYTKKFTEQTAVDAMAQAITDAIAQLNVKDADYSGVEAAIENAQKKLEEMRATGYEIIESTVTALTQAIEAVDYTLTGEQQKQIDAMAKAINDAAAALAYVPKMIISDTAITTQDGYMLGFTNVAGEQTITDAVTVIGNVRLVITPVTVNDQIVGYGTGTLVQMVDENDQVLESYTIVVLGDIDGDGYATVFDVAILTELVNEFEEAATEAQMMAADLCADGYLDVMDLAYVISMANGEYYI